MELIDKHCQTELIKKQLQTHVRSELKVNTDEIEESKKASNQTSMPSGISEEVDNKDASKDINVIDLLIAISPFTSNQVRQILMACIN